MRTPLIVAIIVALACGMTLDILGVCEKIIDWATPVVLAATLIAVILYTSAANKLASATQKHVEIVTKEYEHSRWPVVSFLLGLDRKYSNITGDGFMSGDSTPVKLVNQSGLDAVVWVALNLKIDGKQYDVGGDAYTGKEPWNLQARGEIGAPGFDINEAIAAHTGHSTYELRRMGKREKVCRITLEIAIKYQYAPPKKIHKDRTERPIAPYYLEKAPLRYYLNWPESNRWIFDVRFANL